MKERVDSRPLATRRISAVAVEVFGSLPCLKCWRPVASKQTGAGHGDRREPSPLLEYPRIVRTYGVRGSLQSETRRSVTLDEGDTSRIVVLSHDGPPAFNGFPRETITKDTHVRTIPAREFFFADRETCAIV